MTSSLSWLKNVDTGMGSYIYRLAVYVNSSFLTKISSCRADNIPQLDDISRFLQGYCYYSYLKAYCDILLLCPFHQHARASSYVQLQDCCHLEISWLGLHFEFFIPPNTFDMDPDPCTPLSRKIQNIATNGLVEIYLITTPNL